MSTEFEAHERALIIADAAFNLAKDDLRGRDLTLQLSTPGQVPTYLPYQEPEAGSSSGRNPIDPYEARNIGPEDGDQPSPDEDDFAARDHTRHRKRNALARSAVRR